MSVPFQVSPREFVDAELVGPVLYRGKFAGYLGVWVSAIGSSLTLYDRDSGMPFTFRRLKGKWIAEKDPRDSGDLPMFIPFWSCMGRPANELWESVPRRLRKELVRKSRDAIAAGNFGMIESPSLCKDAEELAKTLATDVLYWSKYGWLPD